MPDMEWAVQRIFEAREKNERIVIFWDYDVDGVSSTALLVKFLTSIDCRVSYRLPHRVNDGYGLKNYFFTELASKNVSLVITVDCGTRDIEPIRYAKSLGIDVIVTDHHAVPEIIPEEVIGVLNPKRKDSTYPFSNLAGAGVAFVLLHALAIRIVEREYSTLSPSEQIEKVHEILSRYVDLASLGTVADCMPLVGENRIITTLGLRAMATSSSNGLRKFLEGREDSIEGNADIIGFQIGPRINAAGRMDSPLKALHWLLASEERADSLLEEIEYLNTERQESVKQFTQLALESVDATKSILFYTHEELQHGLIGLVAGKLTETYNKPSIVLTKEKEKPHAEIKKREYEKEVIEAENVMPIHYVASCRSPEWCHLVELLDACKHRFVRYGGHRQAAGFTIASEELEGFKTEIEAIFHERYDRENLPKKTIEVECILDPQKINLETVAIIDRFRPFGIGNRKPIFLLENLTLRNRETIGATKTHLRLVFEEIPDVKCLLWNYQEYFWNTLPAPGDILSILVELEKNIWNGRTSLSVMIKDILIAE